MKNVIFYAILIGVFTNTSFGQVLTRKTNASQISVENISKRKNPIKNSFYLAEPNLQELTQEDKVDSERGLPFRFGVAMDVDLGTAIGKWEKVSDGRVWSLKINSKNAKSINLLYDYFYLPYGATMIIYNSDKTIISGPITKDQNSDGRAFGSDIIIGNSIIVELFEPNYSLGLSKLHINKVVYGYKNISESGPGFGESWSYNIDVVCSPEGDGWQEESDAVAMVIVNGTRMCSGALINNACQDFTPNFLTAFHCLDDGDGVLSQQEEDALQNWVFRFKYKSSTCGGGDNYSYVSMSGSTFRAGWVGSDFALLELNQRPKANSGIRYSGWSRTSNPPNSSVAIHHPAGDVMKISVDNDLAVSHPLTINWGDAPSTPPNSHWLLEFDAGTTQGGSSGSPIFDQNQRIVGQLHGGEFGCAPVQKYVGRFDVSWNGDGTDETHLSTWLSNNTNTTETNTISIPAILGVDAISGPDRACYYQTAIFNLSNDPLPPNSVFEGWEFSPKLNLIYSTNTSIGVYGVAGAYYGDAWVQATFRNQCNNQIIWGERKNFMLYHDFNPGEAKVTWSTSGYYGYQPITNFWNPVPTGYVYFRFNNKLINENVVRTYGDAYIYEGDEYDPYDFYIYMPTVNSYNFFNFTGAELCGGESFSQTASFMVSVGGLYKVASNPVSNNTATLIPAIESQELSVRLPIVQEILVKNNMGVEVYHCENTEESVNISIPINKKGLFYITLIGKDGWKETHRIIKN